MTSSPCSAVRTDPWAAYVWVLGRIRVDCPEQRISEPCHSEGMAFLLPEDGREVMVDFAGRPGDGRLLWAAWVRLRGLPDDGTCGSDGDPYYVWWVRVPQALHTRRGASGWPLAIAERQQQLGRMFAHQHAWEVRVDGPLAQALHDGKPLPPMR
ncbi:hypothetical protein [Streptomyces sp. NPDC051662]|uniref:hypothetical protein n=1 Tax=Streptomyces sp. NPDC051662 TaxID=3154750 RepID=UPI00344803E1